MSILSSTPTTVADAIAPLKKIVSNLKDVKDIQKQRAESSQAKIDAARRTMETTERAEAAIINSAVSEEVAAASLLAKLEELMSLDVPSVAAMKPADKMSAGHSKDKA